MNCLAKRKIRKLKRALENISIEKLTRFKLESYFNKSKDTLPFKDVNLYPTVIGSVERALIGIALERTSFNQIKCSELLGINRNTLRRKIREYKISVLKSPKNCERKS